MADMSPMGGAEDRPGPVTAAGVLLVVGGVLGILGGLGAAVAAAGGALPGGFVGLVGIISLSVGVVELVAGVKVLALSATWRNVALALAVIGILVNLPSLARGPLGIVSFLLILGINGFIIWALTKHAVVFTR